MLGTEKTEDVFFGFLWKLFVKYEKMEPGTNRYLVRGELMGNVVTARCDQCGYRRELHLGGGMRDCRMETILYALPPAGRTQLEAQLPGMTSLSIDRKAAFCPECREWFALPAVKCVSKTKTLLLYGTCPACGKPGGGCLPETEEKRCPECGAPLSFAESGLWD